MTLTLDHVNDLRARLGAYPLEKPYQRTRPPYKPPKHLRDPRWQPWDDSDPAFSTLARCVEHKWPASETVDMVPDGVGGLRPNVNRRSDDELAHGPLVPLHTMVDGRCRTCHERATGVRREGPAHRDVREAEAAKRPEPPASLFDATELEPASDGPSAEDMDAYHMTFQTERRERR